VLTFLVCNSGITPFNFNLKTGSSGYFKDLMTACKLPSFSLSLIDLSMGSDIGFSAYSTFPDASTLPSNFITFCLAYSEIEGASPFN
jgi:hypothetical protein